MIYIGDDLIERIIREDAPSLDLTTWTLGLRDQPGRLRYISREDIVMCGTEETARICARLGVQVVACPPSGTRGGPGTVLLEATGDVAALHVAWRACLKVLESCSGIATRTARLVAAARSVNPTVEVLTTCKHFPGAKDLSIKAITVGGALPHRLGLSETLLVFDQHRLFCGGLEVFLGRIKDLRDRVPEKRLMVEVVSLAEAQAVAGAGADGIQFDKVPPEVLDTWVPQLRAAHPGLVLLAAGGVTEAKAAAYAATGVNGLVTSAVYFGRPADLQTRITPTDAAA